MFGGDEATALVEDVDANPDKDVLAGIDLSIERDRVAELLDQPFTQDELEDGLALNAAVILDEPDNIDGAIQRLANLLGRGRSMDLSMQNGSKIADSGMEWAATIHYMPIGGSKRLILTILFLVWGDGIHTLVGDGSKERDIEC